MVGKKIVLSLACIALIASGFLAGVIYQKRQVNITDGGTACTMEAKICPDGTAIGRQPPDCEFPDCTATTVTCTEEARLCPDGTSVSREGPNCEFPDCPDGTDANKMQ